MHFLATVGLAWLVLLSEVFAHVLEWRPFGLLCSRLRISGQEGLSRMELQQLYVDLPSATEANEEKDHVAVAGRVIARRVFGKLAFLTMRDDSGDIQV
jgi:hypothetical protein